MLFSLQAPSDSSIGQGLAEGGAQENSATLCLEVTKLTTSLQEYQDLVQVRLFFQVLKSINISQGENDRYILRLLDIV